MLEINLKYEEKIIHHCHHKPYYELRLTAGFTVHL